MKIIQIKETVDILVDEKTRNQNKQTNNKQSIYLAYARCNV